MKTIVIDSRLTDHADATEMVRILSKLISLGGNITYNELISVRAYRFIGMSRDEGVISNLPFKTWYNPDLVIETREQLVEWLDSGSEAS